MWKLSLFIVFLYFNVGDGQGFPPNLTWAHSLKNQKELEEYINSDKRMSEEAIVFNDGLKAVVMGTSATGTFTLEACIKYMKQNRKEHGIKLLVPSAEVFYNASTVLKELSGDWIIISFTMAKGPNGGMPAITTEQLNLILIKHDWPPGANLGIGVSVSYNGPETSYRREHLYDVYNTTVLLPNIHAHKLVIFVDAYFLSKSGEVVETAMSYFEKQHYIEYRLENAAQADKVDVSNFMHYFRLRPNRSYLNFPAELQQKVLEEYSKPTSGQNSNRENSLWLLIFVIIFAYVN